MIKIEEYRDSSKKVTKIEDVKNQNIWQTEFALENIMAQKDIKFRNSEREIEIEYQKANIIQICK